ncbi:MAG: DUF4912 domain-containing protein [Treponema sp.]|jgi:hypothetical protein|nr:DUF4912 domain-containing protein [Treponema sp.]
MDHLRLVRPYLDSLTTLELVQMADECGIDIPPGLERVFIIEELLDYARAEESDLKDEDDLEEAPDYLETAPIPRQYNITFIDVMVRDPLWVFVFWEVKEHDREAFERAPDFSGYFLRVTGSPRDHRSFSVQVEADDNARYLGFSDYPPEGREEGTFRVELCAGFGGRWEVLALSRIFRLPKLQDKVILDRESAELSAPGLPVLSGSNEFRILRNTDRHSHLRFSCGESR